MTPKDTPGIGQRETFVLVTGAWPGGWCWRPVAEALRANGHRVLTPTLPGLGEDEDRTAHTLEDVIDFVVDLIEGEDLSDVALVGHSWGGYVITGAAPRLVARLSRLVYWSAFVPRDGVALYDEVPPAYRELFDGLAAASPDNSVAMPLEVWSSAFMQDATPEVQAMIHSLLVPQPMQYLTTPVAAFDADPAGVTVQYVLGDDDVALPPDTEFAWSRHCARLGVEPISVRGSHEACFTNPAGLAQAFEPNPAPVG